MYILCGVTLIWECEHIFTCWYLMNHVLCTTPVLAPYRIKMIYIIAPRRLTGTELLYVDPNFNWNDKKTRFHTLMAAPSCPELIPTFFRSCRRVVSVSRGSGLDAPVPKRSRDGKGGARSCNLIMATQTNRSRGISNSLKMIQFIKPHRILHGMQTIPLES